MKPTFATLTFVLLAMAPLPALEVQTDIQYKTTPQGPLALDLYMPSAKNSAPRPLVVYTHGGGWAAGSKNGAKAGSMRKVVEGLTDNGFCVASIDYRLYTKKGSEVKRISWIKEVTVTSYDADSKTFATRSGVDLSQEEPAITVFPAWHSNMLVHPFVYFACFEFHGKRQRKMMDIGPKQSLARINVETGKVEYLQLPFPIPAVEGQIEKNGEIFYPKMTINSRGIDVAEDKRSGRSGWWWCFNGNTIAVNQYLYFTFMCGKVQVIDGQAKNFDQSALVSLNDLGTFGETWSCNTPSYSRGRLFHRTLKELICIENGE